MAKRVQIVQKFLNQEVVAIWRIFTIPTLKTILFGGVPTGNINANDAEIVAGNININGLISVAIAIPANIGKTVFVVAVLEVSSVKKVKRVDTIITIPITP